MLAGSAAAHDKVMDSGHAPKRVNRMESHMIKIMACVVFVVFIMLLAIWGAGLFAAGLSSIMEGSGPNEP